MQAVQTVVWHSVDVEMPDDELTVLIALNDDVEPVWFGYHDSEKGHWFTPENALISSDVTHWAELPEPPESDE
jgi:hypothetical protein